MHGRTSTLLLLVAAAHFAGPVSAQVPTASDAAQSLYAVEIKTGASWDAAKPPHEQLHFRDHSINLKRLRDQGSLLIGARYSDKGLLVLRAASEQDAHAMMSEDPSIRAKVFAYEVHPFNVFYGGSVQPKPRGP